MCVKLHKIINMERNSQKFDPHKIKQTYCVVVTVILQLTLKPSWILWKLKLPKCWKLENWRNTCYKHIKHPALFACQRILAYTWEEPGLHKGGSEFSRSFLSTDRSTNWQKACHQKWCTPSSIWLFTLYCKTKIISYVCIIAYWTLRANACYCSCSLVVTILKLRSYHSAWAGLSNYVNPVAKY